MNGVKTLSAVCAEYTLLHGVSGQYADALALRVRRFGEWLGRDATVADLTSERVSQWIAALQSMNGRGAKTIKDYRAAILSLWRWCYNERMTDKPPLRVRPVKVPRVPPQAWTLAEVRQLLAACEKLPGIVPHTGIPRAKWFAAYVRVAFCTALRHSDILRLERSNLAPDGILRITQSKTGDAITLRLSPSCVLSVNELAHSGVRLLPWPGNRRDFFSWFAVLVGLANIRPGTSRWLRRSAASYVERERPGAARLLLGHRTAGLAERHYLDAAIVQRVPEAPPEL